MQYHQRYFKFRKLFYNDKDFVQKTLDAFDPKDLLNFLKTYSIRPSIRKNTQYFYQNSKHITNLFKKLICSSCFYLNCSHTFKMHLSNIQLKAILKPKLMASNLNTGFFIIKPLFPLFLEGRLK